MKTTILTFALALATMPLTFGQTPTPATAPAATAKPAVAENAKTVKKHHKKAVKKAAKTNAVKTTAPAPVKQ